MPTQTRPPILPTLPHAWHPDAPPPVVILSEALQDLAVVAFRVDRSLAPADVVAATIWALALFVVAWEAEGDDVDGETPTSVAAVDGLQHAIRAARAANRAARGAVN
jgi:hypothetical protein